jgi:hypothetical protein
VDQTIPAEIPETISFEVTASLPVVYATVIYGLVEAARMKKGRGFSSMQLQEVLDKPQSIYPNISALKSLRRCQPQRRERFS